MKNICVFFGGESIEHDVSVITGVMTLNSIDKQRYNPVPVYVGREGKWYYGDELFDVDNYKNLEYKKLKHAVMLGGDNTLYVEKRNKLKKLFPISACINCMHGERGEDGSLAGLLKMSGIPLVSPGIMPSALFMDKVATKYALKGIGVKTLPFIKVTTVEELEKARRGFGLPLIVKPTHGGSSIGVSVVKKEEDLCSALSLAMRFDDSAIVEPLLTDFTEINCAVYKNKKGELVVSECEEPVGKGKTLTFDDKYSSGKRIFPARIERSKSEKIKRITARIYQSFSFSGVIRVDYFISNGEVFVCEVNTVPGSLAFYLFSDTLHGYGKILTDWIEGALSRNAKETSIQKEYSTTILSLSGLKGAKKGKKEGS